MKIKLSLLIFLIQVSSFYCQNTNSHSDPHKIVPPTQETFNLSKVDYSGSTSGEFSYSYPIAGKDFRLPVSLNYSSGVKVNDVGGSVGLSWQLLAGGTISRIVKDETDENHVNWKPETVNQTSDLLNIREASYPGNSIDTEYDWFNFSISNGLSGAFYIDQNLNAYVEGNSKIKITVEERTMSVASPYGKMLEFKIIDKEGNEYYFGGQDSNVEKTIYESNGPDQLAFTGWYLNKVRFSDSKEINFQYSLENVEYFSSLDASFYVKERCYPDYDYDYSDISKTKSLISSIRPRIERMTSENNYINFNYTEQRQDVFANSTTKLLSSIELGEKQNNVQKFIFEYEHPVATNAASYYNIAYNESTTRHRHFLKMIKNDNQNSQISFEYDRLSLIPARFSLNTDYFGYANGQNNSSPFPAIGSENNFGVFSSFQNIVPLSILSAQKVVDPLLTSLGNLTKIIHPTKGVSQINYEPNKATSIITEAVPLQKGFIVNYNKCDLTSSTPSQSIIFISDGSPISFGGNASYLDYLGCGDPDLTKDYHRLKITNLTDSNYLPITFSNNISDALISGSPVSTQAGHQYKVEYSVFAKLTAVEGNLTIKYNSTTTTNTATEFFGGSRVYDIRDNNMEGEVYTRKFYYTSLKEIPQMRVSVKNYNPSIVLATSINTSLLCNNASTFPEVRIVNMHTASTNNLSNSFTDRNNKIFYSTLTEIVENKSAIEKTYSYSADIDGYVGRIPIIHSMPQSNYNSQFRNGLLKEEIHYEYRNNKFDTIRQSKYVYDHLIERKNKSYVFRENFMYTPNQGEDPLINISYSSYENYYGSLSPTFILNKEFVNGQAITKTTTNTYNNPSHFQLTTQTSTFPDNSVQETKYQYASEKGNLYMTEKNMVGIPLETEVKKNGVVISKTETKYPVSQADADAKTSGLPLPVSVSGLDLQSNAMNMGVLYKKYDTHGNLLQYNLQPNASGDSGNPVTIIWGYGNTQPIAKVEGIGYDALMAFPGIPAIIADLQSKSAADVDVATEQILISALDSFRKNSSLATYTITTYTYNPLVGVTSITPPSGIREIYLYDTANRLQSVKDVNGNVLKEYQYHYKP